MNPCLPDGQDRVLLELSQVLWGQALDLDRALEAALHTLSHYLALTKAGVLLREEGGPPRAAATLGLSPKELGGSPLPAAALDMARRPAWAWLVLGDRPEVFFLNQFQDLPAKEEVSLMGAPMVSGGATLGILWVDRVFGVQVPVAEDLRLLQRAAAIMARVMSLNQEVRRREEGLQGEILSLRRELTMKPRLPRLMGEGPATRGRRRERGFLSRLKEMEKREILAALERNGWVQSQAAVDLGLTLRQMGYRVKQFGLGKLIKEHRGQGTRSRA